MNIFIHWTLSLFAAALAFTGTAQTVPPLINYQGKLTDPQGQPLSTADYTLTFRIYDTAQGVNPVWGPQIFDGSTAVGRGPKIPVVQGYFNTMLGPVDIHNRSLAGAFSGPERFLEITVGQNPPVSPRQRLLSAPYALKAADADRATDAQNAVNAQNAVFAQNAVNAQKATNAQVAASAQTAVSAQNAVTAQNSLKLAGFDWSALFGSNNPETGKIPLSKLAETVPNTIAYRQVFERNDSWRAPANLSSTVVLLFGCGGGGGGAGSGGGSSTAYGGGGGGGGGAAPAFRPVAVQPGQSYSVVIGEGGVGGAEGGVNANGSHGSDGGSTTFGNLAEFFGGWAGLLGVRGIAGADTGGEGGMSNGAGGEGGHGGAQDNSFSGARYGGNSPYARGGRSAGERRTAGGGGGAGFKAGGDGGASDPAINGGQGSNGEAGGGGGGAGGGPPNRAGGRGGKGGNGYLEVIWFAPK